MSRFTVTLQAIFGLALLFGGAWLAVEPIVGPSAEAESQAMASSNARLAAAELASAWDELRERQRVAARALQGTGTLEDLGASIRDTAQRERALERALMSARAQLGDVGDAALFGPERELLAGGGSASAFAKLPGTIAALEGGTSTRLERVGEDVMLVTATPIGGDDAKSALVLATPLSKQRLHQLVPALPPDTSVVLVAGNAAVVGTLNTEAMGRFEPNEKGSSIVLERDLYAAHRRSLGDDSASEIRAVGLAKINEGASAQAIPQVRLLLLVLFGVAVVLVFLLGALAPAYAEAPADRLEAPPAPAPSAPIATHDEQLASALREPTGSVPRIDLPSQPPSSTGTPAPVFQDFPQAPPKNPTGEFPPLEPSYAPPPTTGRTSLDYPPSTDSLEAPLAASSSIDFPSSPSQSTDSLEAQFALKTMPASQKPDPSVRLDPVSPSALGQQRALPDPGRKVGVPYAPGAQRPSGETFDALETLPGTDSLPSAGPYSPPTTRPAAAGESAPASRPAPQPPPPVSAFDAIAQAARTPAPQPPSAISLTGGPDDLPAPKGEVPPELAAAQRADAQRRAYETPQTPPPKSDAYSTPYDRELLTPKGEAIPLPASGRARTSDGGPSFPPQPAPERSGASNPWQNPSVPAMPAAQTDDYGPSGTVRGLPKSQVGMSVPSFGPGFASTRPAPAPSLDLEPFDEGHYRSVYDEFVSSKANLGEAVDGITYEGFRTKLRSSEQALLDRHGCRAVRFQVLVRDRTVSLRPQLVR